MGDALPAPLRRRDPRLDGGAARGDVAPAEDGDEARVHPVAMGDDDLRRLGHGVRRLDERQEAVRLDHAEGFHRERGYTRPVTEGRVEGRVERWVAGGWALVRTAEGIVFARGVAPGERVALGGVTRRRGAAFASDVEILEASSDRIEPACGYAGRCGGCDFQHMTVESEREAKREMLRDALRRTGKIEPEIAPVAVSPAFAARASARLQGGGGHLGYFARETNDLVPIESCPILAPALRAALPDLVARRSHVKSLLLRTDGTRVLARSTAHRRSETRWIGPSPSDGRLRYPILGREFLVSPTSFFQVNPPVAGLLVAFAREALATPPPGATLWDLYAGVGLFGLSLADRYREVRLLEIARSSVEDARANAVDVSGASVAEWDAARGLPPEVSPNDDAVLDPPREGLSPRLLADLLARGPRRILLVECDLASFARDLGRLAGPGGAYRIVGPVRPFDMFPRTAHLESAALLARNPPEAAEPVPREAS